MNKPIRPAPAWRYRRLAALSALALSTLLNARANTLPEISVQGLQQGSWRYPGQPKQQVNGGGWAHW